MFKAFVMVDSTKLAASAPEANEHPNAFIFDICLNSKQLDFRCLKIFLVRLDANNLYHFSFSDNF